MKLARSRITRQGQISVPAEVRRRLGLTPGAILEWVTDGDRVSVRRVGTFTSEEIHDAVFDSPPESPVSAEAMDEAIASHLAERYARR